MPKATPVIAGILLITLLLSPRGRIASTRAPLGGLAIGASAYLALLNLWAINASYAHHITPSFVLLFMFAGCFFYVLRLQPADVLPNSALYGFKVSLIVSLGIVCSEFITDGLIWNILKSSAFERTVYNKPLVIGCIISSTFIGHYRYPTESNMNIKGWLVALWFSVLLGAALMSQSDATKLGLICAISVVLLENRIPHFYGFLRYGFALYCLALPGIFHFILTPPNLQIFENFLDHSSLHRLYSWKHFNQFVFQSPILGWGPGASFTSPLKGFVTLHPGTPDALILETSTYTHNFVQQAWLEGGFIGITLVILLGIKTLHITKKSSLVIRKNLLFLWVFTSVVMSFGVSIWHHWYWCAILIAVTLSRLSIAAQNETKNE